MEWFALGLLALIGNFLLASLIGRWLKKLTRDQTGVQSVPGE